MGKEPTTGNLKIWILHMFVRFEVSVLKSQEIFHSPVAFQ